MSRRTSRSTRPRAAPSHDVRERAEILRRGRGRAAGVRDCVLGPGDDLRASDVVGSAVDIDLRKGRLAGRYRDGRRQEDGSRTRVRRVGAGVLQGRQVQQGGAESARLRQRLGRRPCEVSGRSGCRAVLRARAAGDCRSVGQDIRAAAPRRRVDRERCSRAFPIIPERITTSFTPTTIRRSPMRALEVARAYGRIAPEVPHALHMPTHIFTRLGLWEDSIDWNKRSAAAALANPSPVRCRSTTCMRSTISRTRTCSVAKTTRPRRSARLCRGLQSPVQTEMASAYALAAIPARIALERQNWAEAAALEPRSPKSFPWASFPAVEAITHFARALGAARSRSRRRWHAVAGATLRSFAIAQTSNAYWGTQVEIQRLAARRVAGPWQRGSVPQRWRRCARPPISSRRRRSIRLRRARSCRHGSCSPTCCSEVGEYAAAEEGVRGDARAQSQSLQQRVRHRSLGRAGSAMKPSRSSSIDRLIELTASSTKRQRDRRGCGTRSAI